MRDMRCLLVTSLVTLLSSVSSADAAPNKELSVTGFRVADGWVVDAAYCQENEHSPTYWCLALMGGHQGDSVILSEAAEWGFRARPTNHVVITGGFGASALSGIVDLLACGLAAGATSSSSDPADPDDGDESCHQALALHAYPMLGARVTGRIAGYPVAVSAVARYHLETSGRASVRAPSGLAVGVGAAVTW